MSHEVVEMPAPVRQFSIQLSSTRRGARLGRLLAVQQLSEWGLPFAAAAQVVAELAANAITHGRVPGRDFRLSLALSGVGTLRIEVYDTRGDRIPLAHDPAPGDAEWGRGLVIVGVYADRWGVEPGPVPGKTVWAEIDPAPGR
ncbi:ATP-binding protein [Streptomyces sp. NBC_01465]|uniref:ATP-binding protein n=1 Tax=Streptomyces sp. NBC_01465 TaxID=2903878 RepID=UPI002E3180A6|nr:ATP-binding protein [Streptomyces sp. NBC_01465]